MKFTKKCDSTQDKISINNKLRNKRRSSAGMFYTSSAGAVTSLILMRKHSTSIAALIFIITLSFIFGFTGATNLFGLNGSAYAVDNISLTVDTNNLAINLATLSSTGDFAKSGNMNIGVSTTSTSGYTLSIASSTGSTDLTNQSDNTKKINSLASAISESDFSSSTNTQYNNKWGYKPSQYVTMNGDTPVIHPNTDYRPLPGTNGEIIAKTSVASPTADNYTLSIGTRANSSTTLGTYTSDTFVITAVTNFTGLTINYDGNGLYFDGDPTKTTNKVVYDATATYGPMTKYAHTPNIDDSGTASGTYPTGSIGLREFVTIPGASSMTVTISYSIEENYDYLYVFTGEYIGPITGAQDAPMDAGQDYTLTGGDSETSGSKSITFTITGDTVTFAFWSDPGTAYYGYYATITGSGYTYSKSAVSGAYTTPGMNTGVTIFKGWSENASDTTPTYTNEAEVSAKLPAVNGDPDVTLYAIYIHSDKIMQEVDQWKDQLTVGEQVRVIDNRDGHIYWVAKQADGNIWMTQNLDLDIGGTGVSALTSENTDLNVSGTAPYVDGYDNSTGIIIWTPNSAAITSDKTISRSSVTGWIDNNSGPCSAEGGDRYYYTTGTTDSEIAQTLEECMYTGHSEGDCAHYHAGNYYNWTAAIASNESSGISSGIAANSICPKGWKIPQNPTNHSSSLTTFQFSNLWVTSGIGTVRSGNDYLSYTTNGFNNIRTSPLYFVRAGRIRYNSLYGGEGNYMSSTVYSSSYFADAKFDKDSLWGYYGNNQRKVGMSVRCMVR